MSTPQTESYRTTVAAPPASSSPSAPARPPRVGPILTLRIWWITRRTQWNRRRRERKLLRTWRKMPPNQQLVVYAKALEESPDLRALVRRALRVKGMEEISAPKVQRIRR
jgi:hypothetical protein